VVGMSNSASGEEAFRWTSGGGMVGLGDLPGGDFWSEALDVSADGSTVVGWGVSASGQEAFIWDQANGMRNLRDVLVSDLGLNLTGWTLDAAYGISDDGQTIVGWGYNPSGNPEAWIATLPEPVTLSLSLDILPGDDPNPFVPNKKGKGKIPMAILGSEEIAAEDINLESILIAGVLGPVKTSIDKDVDGDGLVDLVIHFSRRDLIDTLSLDTYEVGAVVEITVEAVRVGDGCPIEATDSIVIVGRKD